MNMRDYFENIYKSYLPQTFSENVGVPKKKVFQ